MENNLEKLKNRLNDRRSFLLSGMKNNVSEGFDGRTGDDIDLAESAYEQEMAYMLKSREINELKVITEALAKVEKGDYGICEDCEEEIGIKRLEAMPLVKFCVDCQSRIEQEKEKELVGANWDE